MNENVKNDEKWWWRWRQMTMKMTNIVIDDDDAKCHWNSDDVQMTIWAVDS